MKVTLNTPSTNLPIHCSICPQSPNGQHPTFWKYNLHYHILEFHIGKDGKYPRLPPQMAVQVYISREEERIIGISEQDTQAYRDLGPPGSDDPGVLEAKELGVTKRGRAPSASQDERPRKRTSLSI
jgi:hypothetical protein